MLMKRKSLIVAIISSVVVSLVLVLTLVGYLAYLMLSEENFKRTYKDLLEKVNARTYAQHVEFSGLEAKLELTGALKGRPTVSGSLKNKGAKNITGLLVKAKFLDKDGAAIFEMEFMPQEPALSVSALRQVNIPYLSTPAKVILKSGDSLAFKTVIQECPPEIFRTLKEAASPGKAAARWSGKIVCEMVEVDF